VLHFLPDEATATCSTASTSTSTSTSTQSRGESLDHLLKRIRTQDVAQVSLSELEAILSKEDDRGTDNAAAAKAASWLYHACRGIEDSEIAERGPPKSISVSMSLTPIRNDLVAVAQILGFLCKDMAAKLRTDQQRMSCAGVGVCRRLASRCLTHVDLPPT